jgi:3-keto-L-gulonate-6-phosphate decarboxylase
MGMTFGSRSLATYQFNSSARHVAHWIMVCCVAAANTIKTPLVQATEALLELYNSELSV